MEELAASRPGHYQYEPLKGGEIRLMSLRPGTFSSPLRVILTSTPFSPDAPPRFEALSYAWGTAENPVDIFVGSSGYQTLEVTKNFVEALPYLRLDDEPRNLWIDAICVNQLDMTEGPNQGKRMADIYSNAFRVVVWLGKAAEGTSLACDILETIDAKVCRRLAYIIFEIPLSGC